MTQATKWMAIAAAVCAIGCGKKKDQAPVQPSPTAGTPASGSPTPSASAGASPTPSAAPVDPFAMGWCEYKVDGGEALKGGGGMNNVGSLHWMPENQPGRSLGNALIINCGPSGKQVNLSATGDTTVADVPMKPGKYAITTTGKKGDFTAIGADFMGGTGTLDITAWDTSHVAGSFTITSGLRKFEGSFDLKCPSPGNGICS